jgi:hypothetical protein
MALMASLVLGATGCCCGLPCGDLGGLLGATTMTTSPGDYSDIPAYPGSRRLSEVAIPALVKTLVEGMSGGKFDVKGYGTGDAPDKVAAYYDQTMPGKGWSGSFGSGASSGASTTSQMGQYQKGDDTIAMIFVDKDTTTGETAIIIMRMVIPTKTP